MRLELTHDHSLGAPNTWRLLDDGVAITARVSVGDVPEVAVTVRLRYRATGAARPDAFFTREVRDGVWVVAVGQHHESLPPLELELVGAPEHTADALRAL